MTIIKPHTIQKLDMKDVQNDTMKDVKGSIQQRKSANQEILKELNWFIMKHPELRFWQIMSIFGYELKQDRFYEESVETLNYIKKKINDKENNSNRRPSETD